MKRIAADLDPEYSTWISWVGVKAAYLRLRNTLSIFTRTRSAPTPGTSWLTDRALNVVARARYAGRPVHGLARRHYRTGGRQPGRVSEVSLRTFFGSRPARLDLATAAVARNCRLLTVISRVSLGRCTVKACITVSLRKRRRLAAKDPSCDIILVTLNFWSLSSTSQSDKLFTL